MSRWILAAISVAVLSACSSGGGPFEAAILSEPPQTAREIGGSVDTVTFDATAGTLRVTGWGLVTPKTKAPQIRIYANGANAIVSAVRVTRVDVVKAVGDQDLTEAGFDITIATTPGEVVTDLCITTEDKHYGPRLLNPYSAEQIRCVSAGQ
jgi:hypothetical protein